ncbi:MAG TPA: alpha/beta fold hydrolase [Devosia sp.]|nr:alpha/beta fold hydrolase [Devosia sp.]
MTIKDRSTFHSGGRVGFLLIHGLGGTPVELRFVAQGLARAGHTVYCCQLAGHCGTIEDLRTSTWQQWYASVKQAHDRLKEHCDIIIAGGLSMGGILALHLAHERPQEVHGLALYAPTLKLDGWAMPWYSFVLRWVRPTPIKFELNLPEHDPYGIKDERLRAFVVGSMLSGDSSEAGVFSTPVRSFAHFNSLLAVVKKELRRITTPALIIHPREDDIASLGNALYLQRKLGGLVDTVVLDDSYHIVTLDRQRHVVVERSIAFAEAIEKSADQRAAIARPLHRVAAE